MKVRLNKLPVKTTNGFKINDVELELEIPNYKRKKDVLIEGDMSSLKIEKTFTKKTSTSRIGLEVLEYEELTIQVPKGIHVKEPIMITYSLQENDSNHSQMKIVYEEDSSCNFVITTRTEDDTPCFSHIVEHVTSKKNSSGKICYFNFKYSF